MTKEEFELALYYWAANHSAEMRAKISGGTHGSGHLQKKIKYEVKESQTESIHYVGFNFKKYGVFVHYGVGRGWVRQGNTVVRGSRVKKGSEFEAQLKKKGYSRKDIKTYVVEGSGSGHERKPVDWFDSVIKSHMDELATIAQEYYGEYSQEKLAEMIDRMTIGKKES